MPCLVDEISWQLLAIYNNEKKLTKLKARETQSELNIKQTARIYRL